MYSPLITNCKEILFIFVVMLSLLSTSASAVLNNGVWKVEDGEFPALIDSLRQNARNVISIDLRGFEITAEQFRELSDTILYKTWIGHIDWGQIPQGVEDLARSIEDRSHEAVRVNYTPQDVLVEAHVRSQFGSIFERAAHEENLRLEDSTLFQERERRLRTIMGIPSDLDSLYLAEHNFVENLLEAAEGLLRYPPASPVYEAFLQQFTEAAFSCLNYRHSVAERYLIGNKQASDEYRRQQWDARVQFYNEPQIRHLNRLLKKLAPSLVGNRIQKNSPGDLPVLAPTMSSSTFGFTQRQRDAEQLLDRYENSYERSPQEFTEPPMMEHILGALRALKSINLPTNYTSLSDRRSRTLFYEAINNIRLTSTFWKLHKYLKLLVTNIDTLASFPEDTVTWNDEQKRLWLSHIYFLSRISKILPYKYLDLAGANEVDGVCVASEKKDKKAKVGRKQAVEKERDEAAVEQCRLSFHRAIPWKKLQRLGLLIHHKSEFEPYKLEPSIFADILPDIKRVSPDPAETERFLLVDIDRLIMDAAPALISELQGLIPIVETWFAFEVAIASGQAWNDNIPPVPSTQTLDVLSDFEADITHLQKIKREAGQLELVRDLPVPAFLRLLTIFGESAKNMSKRITLLLGQGIWSSLAKMRDQLLHIRGYLKKLEHHLQSEPLRHALLDDFRTAGVRAGAVLSEMPINWSGIQTFYDETYEEELRYHGGVNQLIEMMDPVLTQADFAELRATRASSNREVVVAFARRIMRSLNSVDEARHFILDTEAQNLSPEAVQRLNTQRTEEAIKALTPLSQGEQKRIREFLVKQREGGLIAFTKMRVIRLVQKVFQRNLEAGLQKLQMRLQAVVQNGEAPSFVSEADWKDIVHSLFPEKVQGNEVLKALQILSRVDLSASEEEKERQDLKKLLTDKVLVRLAGNGWDVEFEKLIHGIRRFSNEESLRRELDELCITDKDKWEAARKRVSAKNDQKVDAPKEDKATRQTNPDKYIDDTARSSLIAAKAIVEHFNCLNAIMTNVYKTPTPLKKEMPWRTNWYLFEKEPANYLVAEHHIQMIRVHLDVIQEVVRYLIRHDIAFDFVAELNRFYVVLSSRLRDLRQGGNVLAHLHDINEMETMTAYGSREAVFHSLDSMLFSVIYPEKDGSLLRPPSLLEAIQRYVNLLSLQLGTSFPQRQQENNTGKTHQVFLNNSPIATMMEEHEISGIGNNCGFIGLGVRDRVAAIEDLVRHIRQGGDVAEMVREEVRVAFLREEFPPSMQAGAKPLFRQRGEQADIIDGVLAELRAQFGEQFIDIDAAYTYMQGHPFVAAENIQPILELITERDRIEQEIYNRFYTPEALVHFVRAEYVENPGMLSYIPGQRGTLYALAHINNHEVYIIEDREGRLQNRFEVPPRVDGIPPANIIYLRHTGFINEYGRRHLNHFNLLHEVNAPNSNPQGQGTELRHEQNVLPALHHAFLTYYARGLDELLILRIQMLENIKPVKLLKSQWLRHDGKPFTLSDDVLSRLQRGETVLIPYNLWGQHWVGIALEREAEGQILVNYMDPENKPMPQELTDQITNALLSDSNLHFVQIPVEQQRYNNCGPEVIENFVLYLTGKRVSQEEAVPLHSWLLQCRLVPVDETTPYKIAFLKPADQFDEKLVAQTQHYVETGEILPTLQLAVNNGVVQLSEEAPIRVSVRRASATIEPEYLPINTFDEKLIAQARHYEGTGEMFQTLQNAMGRGLAYFRIGETM